MLTSAALATFALLSTQGLPDLDMDGLPDEWESNGHGPIEPKVHGCKPGRPDFFLIVCMRPGMSREQVRDSLDRVKKVFADTPGKNGDGSTGINMIVVWGNELAEEDRNTPYPELYEKGMPQEWRGLGHGVLLEPGTGGGGQANRSDWAGISNNWKTIVHELGHQFGLGHEPEGSPGQSPMYTSLMNYDYSYSFNGNGEAVHLSSGKFKDVKLDETKLDENLPFPIEDLEFLIKGPYHFRVERVDEKSSRIDWNRNGVFGENPVVANIDDGYGVGMRDVHRLGKAAGSPALAATADTLYVIYPELSDSKQAFEYAGERLSTDRPGNLSLTFYKQKEWSKAVTLAENVTGDPSLVLARNRMFLAYETAGGIEVGAWTTTAPFKRRAMARFEGSDPCLVSTNDQIWLFTRFQGSIKYRRIRTDDRLIQVGKEYDLGVQSQSPTAAVFDSISNRIVLVTNAPLNNMQGRMRIHTIKAGDRQLSIESTRWTMGEAGHSRTLARPCVLFDPSKDRGTSGGYLVYHKGEVAEGQPSATWVSRTLGDRTASDGWRTSLLGNEWLLTRSAPAAVMFDGDIAYALRWYGGDRDNDLLVHLRASGVVDGLIADQDDVAFIRQKGLRQSLGR